MPRPSISTLWYNATAPKEVSEGASLEQRERVRRGRVASIILLVIILLVVLPIPTAIGNPILLITLLTVIALDCFSLFYLNRRGMSTLAGVLVVVGIEVGLGMSALTYPGGFGPSNLPLLDLLVQAEIVAVAMLPTWSVIVVAVVDAVFIVFVLTSHVTTPALSHLVATDPGRIIVQPITLLIAVATIVIVLVNSANQAIRRADRAEEIAELERREIERQQQEIELSQQLDVGIQQILQTHVKVSNGDFTARAPIVDKNNVLWRVAYSLNTLLARLQGYKEMDVSEQRTQAAIQYVVRAIRQAKNEGGTPQLHRTGTHIDELINELNAQQLSNASRSPISSRTPRYPM